MDREYRASSGAAGATAAADVTNTPAGAIAATNVQTALNELDTEKAPLASPTFTGTVAGASSTWTTSVAVGSNPSATGGVRLANSTAVIGRNAANSADISMLNLNGSDVTQVQGSTVAIVVSGTKWTFQSTTALLGEGYNVAFGTTTGSKFGTATTQKLSFWNATPVVQPTTAGAAATFAANTSVIANDTATFDGYTIGQVVKALRTLGLLA